MKTRALPLFVAVACAAACAPAPRLRVVAETAPVAARARADACNERPQKGQPDAVAPPVPVAAVALPDLPQLSPRADRDDGAYTVWGAVSRFRNRERSHEVTTQSITVEGIIVATNFGDAPRCAVHARGIADPDGCRAPIPTLWIADSADGTPRVAVMGFASNFAQLHDARENDRKPGAAPLDDELWGVRIPRPLPDVGARVRVTGRYSTTFTLASSGSAADPVNGILTYASLEYLVPPAEPPVLGRH